MRYLLTNEQMRSADEFATKETPALTLMERAGKGLAEKVNALPFTGEILCVCGGGNNGGDGFVCARYLLALGRAVTVFCNAKNFSVETQRNRAEFLSLGGKIVDVMPCTGTSVIVDCLLGTGFKGELKSATKSVVEKINDLKKQGAYVLSADIPSGLGDNGRGQTVVCADETLCIAQEKLAVRLLDGLDFAGKVSTLDIGISALESEKANYVTAVEKSDVKGLLVKRNRNSHKGTYGKVAVVGGCSRYTGAPYLSTVSALRSGVGYTTLFIADGIAENYILRTPEALIERIDGENGIVYNERDFEKMLTYDAVCYGMGAGVSEDVYKGVEYLLKNYTGKLILDADGLNSLAKYGSTGMFLEKKCETLITPHVKEFSRLTKIPVEEIINDSLECTKTFARENKLTVLLKGASTIITDGARAFLNLSGCSAQAKGGSGDVLAGLIGGLCAQGLSTIDGAVAGAYIVGLSAEIASDKVTEYSALPTDFVQEFTQAFKRVID